MNNARDLKIDTKIFIPIHVALDLSIYIDESIFRKLCIVNRMYWHEILGYNFEFLALIKVY